MRVKRLPILLKLDRSQPVGVQLYHGIRTAITAGQIVSGDALPSSRDLARQFGVARNTILSAINSLNDEALVETRKGVGVFVTSRHITSGLHPKRTYSDFDLTPWAKHLPAVTDVIQAKSAKLDFRPGLPDLKNFSLDDWRRSSVRKLRTLRGQIGSYGEPQGTYQLRYEIAHHVSRSRAVNCEPDDVIITSGAQQAFDLISRVLIHTGMKVAVEEPGYRPAVQTFLAAGATLCPVPVDRDGLDVDQIPKDVRMVYTTPSHQYPLGVTMSDRRRRDLIEWANRSDAVIVEDDYDSEYRYTRNSLPSLQGSDSIGRVIYVGTFSKNLMPGIRLGYLIAPHSLRSVLVKSKWLVDRHSDNISQAVLSDFMSSGGFARHIVKMQAIYSARHSLLHKELATVDGTHIDIFPSVTGLHICVQLRPGIDESNLIDLALKQGLGLHGVANAFHSSSRFQGIILGFGNMTLREIEVGAAQFARITHSMAIT